MFSGGKYKYTDEARKEIVKPGTRYNRYGNRTADFSGSRDINNIDAQISRESQAYGYETNMRKYMKVCDEKGDALQTPQNIGGRTYYPDDKGMFALIDEDGIDDLVEKEAEIERFINSIVEKVIVSNTVAELVLGQAGFTMLGKTSYVNTDPAVDKIFGKSMPTANANAQPSYLVCCGEGTEKYALGLAKLRCVVKHVMPVMQRQTSDAVVSKTAPVPAPPKTAPAPA